MNFLFSLMLNSLWCIDPNVVIILKVMKLSSWLINLKYENLKFKVMLVSGFSSREGTGGSSYLTTDFNFLTRCQFSKKKIRGGSCCQMASRRSEYCQWFFVLCLDAQKLMMIWCFQLSRNGKVKPSEDLFSIHILSILRIVIIFCTYITSYHI